MAHIFRTKLPCEVLWEIGVYPELEFCAVVYLDGSERSEMTMKKLYSCPPDPFLLSTAIASLHALGVHSNDVILRSSQKMIYQRKAMSCSAYCVKRLTNEKFSFKSFFSRKSRTLGSPVFQTLVNSKGERRNVP